RPRRRHGPRPPPGTVPARPAGRAAPPARRGIRGRGSRSGSARRSRHRSAWPCFPSSRGPACQAPGRFPSAEAVRTTRPRRRLPGDADPLHRRPSHRARRLHRRAAAHRRRRPRLGDAALVQRRRHPAGSRRACRPLLRRAWQDRPLQPARTGRQRRHRPLPLRLTHQRIAGISTATAPFLSTSPYSRVPQGSHAAQPASGARGSPAHAGAAARTARASIASRIPLYYRVTPEGAPMKITDVTLTLFAWNDIPPTSYGRHTARPTGKSDLGLLRIVTDEGIEGHAFLGTSSNPASLDGPALIRFLKPQLMGEDPLDRERLNRALWARVRTATVRGIGACDVALWDIGGKAAGLPIHRLIGTCRHAIAAYASSEIHGSREAYVEQARHYQSTGWAAYKIHPPQN